MAREKALSDPIHARIGVGHAKRMEDGEAKQYKKSAHDLAPHICTNTRKYSTSRRRHKGSNRLQAQRRSRKGNLKRVMSQA